jgi:biopolymer transport protein TolR
MKTLLLLGLLFFQNLDVPLQRGISVQMPQTAHATQVPAADESGAPIIAITQEGILFFGIEKTDLASLPGKVDAALKGKTDKTIYLKADSRVPYDRVVKVIDVLRSTNAEGLTLLTNQSGKSVGKFAVPKGLELRVVNRK